MLNNIGEMLVLNANRYPEKTAIVYRDQRLSYREINERANRLAHHLLDLGIRKGDRVGFMFYNCNQYVEIFYATLKIGAVVVPLNFRMVPREIKWSMDNSGCKVLAYGEACTKQVEPVKQDLSTVEHLIYSGKDTPQGERHFETLSLHGNAGEPQVKVGPDDMAPIMFTGGTTGSPKGAVHTHRSQMDFWTITMISTHMSTPSECSLIQVPLFHNAGLMYLSDTLMVGGKLVLVETFDQVEILRMIEQEQATCICLLPPATYIRLLDTPTLKDYDTSSVTRVGTAAGAYTKSLLLRLFDAFPNAKITYAWGQTETLGTINWVDRLQVEKGQNTTESVGRAHSHVEIRLVDDSGRDVPVGEIGEAIVRGPQIMKGYFEQPELTAQTIRDGWVYTGDLLKKDQDGYYYFMDRKKDMIKSGGENVFAQEVEEVIMSYAAAEYCAVIGIPDLKFGEAVMAVVKLRPGFAATEEEIIEHCKQDLSSYKKPRRIAFVDTFPVSDAGKIQKFKLREQYSKSGS